MKSVLLLLLLSLLLLLLLLSLLFLLKKISFKCKFKLYIMMVEHNSFVCIKLQGVSYLGAKEKAPTLQFIVKFITFSVKYEIFCNKILQYHTF